MMSKKIVKVFAIVVALISIVSIFTSCGKEKVQKVEDFVQTATEVKINGKKATSVEARMGAFMGKQGDSIEFKFKEAKEFNTISIIEKTTSVRQYNIYVEIDGKFKLMYTGKHILNQDLVFDPITATGLKFEVVNTEIGNDKFIIQGIGVYKLDLSEVTT